MFKKIRRSKFVSISSLVAFLLVVGGWVWAAMALRDVAGSPIILHFDDINGITAAGSPGTLAFTGVIGVIAALANFFIALELDARDRFLGKFTAGMTLLFAVLLFIGFAAIINVN